MLKNLYPEYPLPPPFPAGEPGFAPLLKTHQPFIPHWDENAPEVRESIALKKGIICSARTADFVPETAYADFTRFLDEAGIPRECGAGLQFEKSNAFEGEDFQLEISSGRILLTGGTTEAFRRGLYYLSHRIASLDTPFLPCGTEKKHFWLKNRISRCFFGPIKRPPFFRDELMDDIDYYPEEYLSELAREGVNGLWLTVEFHDLCSTTYIKEDPNAQKRLAKLRDTVKRCLRYGIKTWIFCIEPVSWNSRHPLPEGAEDLGGPGYGAALTSGVGAVKTFCAAGEKAEKYLFDATFSIFSQLDKNFF